MEKFYVEILRLAEIIEMEEMVYLMAAVREEGAPGTGQLYQKIPAG